MFEELEQLKLNVTKDIEKAKNLAELKSLEVRVFGKKGSLTNLLRSLASLEKEKRPLIGKKANDVRRFLEEKISARKDYLEKQVLEAKLKEQLIDVTLPGKSFSIGSNHPISHVIEEIEDIFINLGFDIVDGNEIETDYYNFEALNISKGHPAREMQDSFYITEDLLLRTHTSPVQIRTLLADKGKIPVRIISAGKVYRRDSDDATHSHQFTQVEGLVVDKGISMGHLYNVLTILLTNLFHKDIKMRFRPSYFPFTEPSVEVDIFDNSKKEWLEILGAGMVHPTILANVGYKEEISGFAFGLGVERIVMLKYGITDIRLLYNNDLRFLRQFISL